MFKAAQRQQLKESGGSWRAELLLPTKQQHCAAMPATWKSLGLALTSASLVMGGQALAVPVQVFETTISEEEVSQQGETWCAALVGISNTFHTQGAAAALPKRKP